MTIDEVTQLLPGLYRITWMHEEGSSLAAIGLTCDGHSWMAPSNWTTSDPGQCFKAVHTQEWWDKVESATAIRFIGGGQIGPAEVQDVANAIGDPAADTLASLTAKLGDLHDAATSNSILGLLGDPTDAAVESADGTEGSLFGKIRHLGGGQEEIQSKLAFLEAQVKKLTSALEALDSVAITKLLRLQERRHE